MFAQLNNGAQTVHGLAFFECARRAVTKYMCIVFRFPPKVVVIVFSIVAATCRRAFLVMPRHIMPRRTNRFALVAAVLSACLPSSPQHAGHHASPRLATSCHDKPGRTAPHRIAIVAAVTMPTSLFDPVTRSISPQARCVATFSAT